MLVNNLVFMHAWTVASEAKCIKNPGSSPSVVMSCSLWSSITLSTRYVNSKMIKVTTDTNLSCT